VKAIYLKCSRYGAKLLNYKLLNLYFITGFALCPTMAIADDYFFDPTLFQGSAFGQDLDRFNTQNDQLLAGDHLLDIFVNDRVIVNQENVHFETLSEDQLMPCLTLDVIKSAQIRFKIEDEKRQCILLDELSKNAYWDVNSSQLKLNLYIPQKDLYSIPRGYIPVSEWDEGNTALFLRHNTNYNHTKSWSKDYDYLWSNVYTGINLGLWQLRHQGNLRYSNSNSQANAFDYNSVRTWVQRPIPALESTLILGDSYTNSNLLGGLSFRGLKLSTDQKMWPQGRRGYAPEVRGIAGSAARVVIKQGGKTIYETSVPPGEFVINDLYNTPMQGDLNVEVIESNGQISTFTVPYSSTPDSVRTGNWNYELVMGAVSQFNDVNNRFIEGTLQYGLNNHITTNFGTRFTQDYQAALIGGVFSSSAGAFGLNTTWSRADLGHKGVETGWRVEGSYSNSFSTGTNIVFSAYRYSTIGFRDLQDVLGVLRQQKSGIVYDSDTLKQRNRLSMTISQPMADWGSFYLTGSTADYYGDKSRINQLQLGYSNTYNNVSYNFSVARQQVVMSNKTISSQQKRTENTISLSVSIPLDFGSNRSSVSFDANKTTDSKNGSVKLVGSAGKKGDFTYALYSGIENSAGQGYSSTWGANVQQNTAIGSFRGAFSSGKHYQQLSVGSSGSLVLHDGGLTFGPYISDTFALVYAPGAKGALIKNGQGASIDRFGYAIMPSLTAYRYNNITLDTSEMVGDAELKGGGERIVPYFGSMTKVSFETITGRAVLINLTSLTHHISIPMGADVLDQNNESIGMVGQGGQIYARLNDVSGILNVNWGTELSQRCQIHYQLPEKSEDFLTMLNLPCVQELM